jgi:hypothetical protein
MMSGFTDYFYEQFKDRNFAFLSPYRCEFGVQNAEIVNGITGVPATFKKEGADYYWYGDLKDVTDAQLKQIASKYDYFLYPVFPEYFHLLKRLRSVFDGVIIGITDIQTHILAYWSMDDINLFIDSLRLYDYIMCTNIDEVQTFRVPLEKPERCAYTGWCMYPDIFHYPIIKDKRDLRISVGINNPGDFNRDILTNIAVYNKLKERFKDIRGFTYYMTPNKREKTQKILDNLGVKDFELVDELPFDRCIDYLSNAYMAIHMYTFKVVGRLTQDCAALGVPMVGTIANLPNRLCFPDTSVNDYYVNEAVELATRLLLDKFFYAKVAEQAIEASKFYNLENTQRRIWALLNAGVKK